MNEIGLLVSVGAWLTRNTIPRTPTCILNRKQLTYPSLAPKHCITYQQASFRSHCSESGLTQVCRGRAPKPLASFQADPEVLASQDPTYLPKKPRQDPMNGKKRPACSLPLAFCPGCSWKKYMRGIDVLGETFGFQDRCKST